MNLSAESWQEHRAVQGLASRLIDRLDQLPAPERKRRLSFLLDESTLPELFLEQSNEERNFVWSLVEKMQRAGWIALEFDSRRKIRSPIPYERSPRAVLIPAAEPQLRSLCGRVYTEDPWTTAWREGCAQASWLSADIRGLLAAREHRIGQRTPQEILSGWRCLLDPNLKAVYLREAAAEIFGGLSKILDDRADLVNMLRASAGLWTLLESPIQLNVHIPKAGAFDTGVLFIENQTTFEAAVRGYIAFTDQLDLVYSAGFKASATRLRNRATSAIYQSPSTDQAECERFQQWFFSDRCDVSSFFWGDLDYSGLAILKSLRAVFGDVRAWEPGYRPMMDRLLAGRGHAPEEADKSDQRDPGFTGCPFADSVMLPAVRQTGQFLDQEAILHSSSRSARPSTQPNTSLS